MIPKVARAGKRFKIQGKRQSFKQAGAYYLHDKGANTANRVLFTHTENLPTDNAELALKCMAYTAMRAEDLKAQAGRAKTGNKREKTVYCYSLSWHPDEAPTKEEMIRAACETMKALKIADREALFVAHSDEPHPHIHIIVNRVSPENGIAAKLGCDWNILQKWALRYEREQGKIRCPQRAANDRERRDRKTRGQSGFVKYQGTGTADYRRMQRAFKKFHAGPALDLNVSDFHRSQRQALYDEKERRIAQRREALRETNRGKWAFMFRQQKAEAKELDETRKSRFKAMLYFLKHRQELKPGGLVWVFQGLIGYHGVDFWDAMNKRHEEARKGLSARVGEQVRDAIAEENELYRTELDMLKHEQAAEWQTLRDEYAQHSPARSRGGEKSGRAAGEKQHAEKPMRKEFEERVGKRIRRQRNARTRKRDKDTGRERDD